MTKPFFILSALPFMLAVLVGLCSCEPGKNEPSTPSTFDKVETLTASELTKNQATLSGRYNVDISDSTDLAFGFLLSNNKERINNHEGAKHTATISKDNEFEVTVKNLTVGTKYYFCAWLLINGSQYEYGEIMTFTTKEAMSGTAAVYTGSGRSSCKWVQLWAGGPKWAAFNVGATITDYANLIKGADATSYDGYLHQASYYNTANVGGLYPWNNPELNGRETAWSTNVSTGISDVATTLWGGKWRTPTWQQLDTLINSKRGKTTLTWCNGGETQYVAGCTLTGYKVSGVGEYADQCIFLPAAGWYNCNKGKICMASASGLCWSNSIDTSNSDQAWSVCVGKGSASVGQGYRIYGNSVRAVLVK